MSAMISRLCGPLCPKLRAIVKTTRSSNTDGPYTTETTNYRWVVKESHWLSSVLRFMFNCASNNVSGSGLFHGMRGAVIIDVAVGPDVIEKAAAVIVLHQHVDQRPAFRTSSRPVRFFPSPSAKNPEGSR